MPGPGTQVTRSQSRTSVAPAGPESGPETGPETEPADGPVRRLTVPGRADQVPRARAFIARALSARGFGSEIACLLGSELVANSVLHSDSRLPGGLITVTVTAAREEVLIEVTDDGAVGLPVLRGELVSCTEQGRGLLLVAALSARWGYQRARGKLTTWVQVPAEPARPTLVRHDAGLPAARHAAEPAAGTLRGPDGQDADLFNLSHYPVRARCLVCGGPIEAESFLRPFGHIPDGSP